MCAKGKKRNRARKTRYSIPKSRRKGANKMSLEEKAKLPKVRIKRHVNTWTHEKYLAYHKEYYQQHKERINAQCLEWEHKHIERKRAKLKRYRANHFGIGKEIHRRYKQRNPEKYKCHYLAAKYPMADKCSKCGSTSKLQRHHEDYSKPEVFITVCQECHNLITLTNRGLVKY
jgi:hypothetical protein